MAVIIAFPARPKPTGPHPWTVLLVGLVAAVFTAWGMRG